MTIINATVNLKVERGVPADNSLLSLLAAAAELTDDNQQFFEDKDYEKARENNNKLDALLEKIRFTIEPAKTAEEWLDEGRQD